MGSGKENKTKFKKTAFLKNRKGDFSLRVRALNHTIILCLLLKSLNNAITRAQRKKISGRERYQI
jgi:hypothetical protein